MEFGQAIVGLDHKSNLFCKEGVLLNSKKPDSAKSHGLWYAVMME